MERADSPIIDARFSKLHVRTHHIQDIQLIFDFFDLRICHSNNLDFTTKNKKINQKARVGGAYLHCNFSAVFLSSSMSALGSCKVAAGLVPSPSFSYRGMICK